MVMGSYLSIITLNVNGDKCSNQNTKTGQMDTKTKPIYNIYAVYKIPTSNLGTHTD